MGRDVNSLTRGAKARVDFHYVGVYGISAVTVVDGNDDRRLGKRVVDWESRTVISLWYTTSVYNGQINEFI